MDPDRLRELIAAYGAEPRRWPEDERDAARDLLARSADAQRRAVAAAALDRELDSLPATLPPPGLATRLAVAAGAGRRHAWWQFAVPQPAAVLAAAAVLGTAAGALAPTVAGDAVTEDDVAALVLGPRVALEENP